MFKRLLVMLVLVVLVATAFYQYKMYGMKKGMQAMQASFSPPSVSTVKAAVQEWQPHLEAFGTLRAVNGADLSAEVAGVVEKLSFDSGAEVETGTVLVHLRDEDDLAKLRALQAAATLAQVTFDRDEKQIKSQAISQATMDADTATLNSAKAELAQQQALVDKKTIRAPFSGYLGIRQVDIGQYLTPGSPIVSLQQLDPLYVDFTMPEQDLPQLAVGQKVILHNDAYSGQEFSGKILALNAKIDEATRNISVRAEFANPDHKLLPGMFAHVTVQSGKSEPLITLPQTAIVFNTYGNVVYVVNSKLPPEGGKPVTTVQQNVVITGATRGDQIAIVSGLKEGDEVVGSGQVKLRNGMPVIISNEGPQPPNDAHPFPHEQ